MQPRPVVPLEYETPPAKPPLPTAVVVVAWIFIAGGILAVVEIVVALLDGRVSINLGVLGIFIGWGLLRRRRGWRTLALIVLWAFVLLMPVAVVALLAAGGEVMVNNRRATQFEAMLFWILLTVLYGATIWMLRTLSRPEVEKLYCPELPLPRAD